MSSRTGTPLVALLLQGAFLFGCSGGGVPDSPIAVHGESSLLLAVPGGMAFRYGIDDVRLTEVLQGEFPPGNSAEPLLLCEEGRPAPTFSLDGQDGRRALSARLLNTWNRYAGDEENHIDPGLTYVLESPDGAGLARVDEMIRPVRLSVGTGFLRQFRIVPLRESLILSANVVNPAGENLVQSKTVSGPPSEDDWSPRGLGRSTLVGFRLDEERFQYVVWSRPGGVSADGWHLRVEIGTDPLTFEVATLLTRESSEAVENSILEEL